MGKMHFYSMQLKLWNREEFQVSRREIFLTNDFLIARLQLIWMGWNGSGKSCFRICWEERNWKIDKIQIDIFLRLSSILQFQPYNLSRNHTRQERQLNRVSILVYPLGITVISCAPVVRVIFVHRQIKFHFTGATSPNYMS